MLRSAANALGRRFAARGERGQAIIMLVFGMTVIFLVAAVAIDMSLWLAERRSVQRAADLAVLAGVQELPQSDAAAIARSYEWAAKNGFQNGVGGVEVTAKALCKNSDPSAPQGLCVNGGGVEPVPCSGSGCDSLRVVVKKPADLMFASIFGIVSFDIEAGASAICAGCVPNRQEHGGPQTTSVPIPSALNCSSGSPEVDGRVQTAAEGYVKLGDLLSITSLVDYGDAFAACDGTHYYIALSLNGPSTGGPVANENVYAGCVNTGLPDEEPASIFHLRGNIVALGVAGFTLDSNGTSWSITVDGDTVYQGGLADFGDLAIHSAVEISGEILGANQVLAGKIKLMKEAFCTASSNDAYHSLYSTGWSDDKHSFTKLLQSDRARFQINCDGVAVHDFVQDYLYRDGADWVSGVGGDGSVSVAGPDLAASSLQWNLEHPIETGWGNDAGENPLEHSPPFNPSYPDSDPGYSGWVWEMIYEFRVPLSAYAGCGEIVIGLDDLAAGSGPLSGLHSSPAKTADGGDVALVPMRAELAQ